MKRIILPFLIVTVCSFGIVASDVKSRAAEGPDSLQVADSLDLFRDITDISRQIERRTAQPVEMRQAESLSLQSAAAYSDSIIIPRVFPVRETVPVVPADSIYRFRNPLDSLYLRKENGTLQLPANYSNFESMRGLSFRDTLFYNPLFLPMIFTGEILPRQLTFYPLEEARDKGMLIPREKTFAPRLDHIDFVRNVRRDYYMKYPDRIRYSVASFDTIPRLEVDDQAVRETFNPFRELIKAETTYSLEAPGIEGVRIKRKYWVRSGEHSFQFAQNYFSDNWHKGGTNNLNFNSYNVFRANYKKDKVKFNNTLEWRLSVFNAPDDSLRKYRIGNDLIRYYGDFGVDAFGKGWSYSTNMEAKSQLFNAYPVNSDNLLSSFLSPLYVNAGIGLKYNLDKPSQKVRHRRLKWELAIAPVSINFTYVWNDSVDVKRFGIAEGRKSQLDIGSTLTSILKYDLTRYITWDSRLTYFTSYEKVISEFENSLNMALSNAFSTRIYVNMRFDDGVPADPKLKHWQVNQTLSFGLNYKW
ncbi:DUF3078 domain-containing protein [uncultured Proteiniphilum sp.]|uniref:DUF3078 domain-containing protein n=1 Tax=uncultured Proteiniphilum sp. TaxID=497637 RepID=UPI00260C34F5|nr:DUF3078 domain-containing protein [uncultured Proteiniphilum sp.]